MEDGCSVGDDCAWARTDFLFVDIYKIPGIYSVWLNNPDAGLKPFPKVVECNRAEVRTGQVPAE